MWYIKNSQGEIIYLKPNKLMVVSRKDGQDIVLRNDTSISKLHASITVRPKINFKENEPSSVVIVQDTGSKYGTFIINSDNEKRKLTPGDHTLSVTDKIKFGLLHHEFTLHYVPLITSTSSLNADENRQLKSILNTLDGVIVNKWKEYCTHLTVSNVKLTAQVVQALAFGTQIVNLKYWRAVLESVENNAELPEVSNFTPSIEEGLINKESVSLKINPERKVLFKNLCFVCFSPSQYQLKDIIYCAGGKLKLLEAGRTDVKKLTFENIIVLQIEDDSSQPSQTSIASYNLIQKTLQEKKLRLIPESEILLAILYCSTEKYCNPKFNFKKLLDVRKNSKNILLSTTILAADTQDILPTNSAKTSVIINETLTESEQIEKSENSKKDKLLFGQRQTNQKNSKEPSQYLLGSKKIFNKTTTASEESSREGCLVVDEAGSSPDSDSDDRNVFMSEFKESINKSKESVTANRLINGPFDLKRNLKTSEMSRKENLVSNPSTSKDVSWRKSREPTSTNRLDEAEENSPRKRPKMSSDQNTAFDVADEASDRKSAKRNATAGENIFSSVNEGAKKKRNNERDETSELFKFVSQQNVRNSNEEENFFVKALAKMKAEQCKRKRPTSVSSDDASSIEEEKPKIKIERCDSDSDREHIPFVRIKKEDTSMDESCKSTIVPLLRTDMDLTMKNTLHSFKKVYTLIPQARIKREDLYIWKSKDGTVVSPQPREPDSASSNDEDDDFKFFNKKEQKRMNARR